MEGKTADAISRGEEPPWNGVYAPIDMNHFLQPKIEKPPYGGLYALGGLYGPSSSNRKDG
jgi:hypothetical protein